MNALKKRAENLKSLNDPHPWRPGTHGSSALRKPEEPCVGEERTAWSGSTPLSWTRNGPRLERCVIGLDCEVLTEPEYSFTATVFCFDDLPFFAGAAGSERSPALHGLVPQNPPYRLRRITVCLLRLPRPLEKENQQVRLNWTEDSERA